MKHIAPLILTLAPLAAAADAPRVATDILPVHALTARVMDGVGTPDLIVPANASPHGHAMRPSEAQALDEAELVIWIGEELTPWLEEPLESLAGDAIKLELISVEGAVLRDFRETVTFDPHGDDHEGHGHDEHAHDHEKDEDHAGHDHDHEHSHNGVDPHVWLDPANALLWTDMIAATLSEMDPDHAETYAANAAAAREEITAAQAEISETLSGAQGANYIVFHDAYQYFETPFGLSPIGAIRQSDADDPSPARIAELREEIEERGVTCAMSEPQFNTRMIDTVLEGTAAKTVVIDPIGTTIPQGADFYPNLLKAMAGAIAECVE